MPAILPAAAAIAAITTATAIAQDRATTDAPVTQAKLSPRPPKACTGCGAPPRGKDRVNCAFCGVRL